MKILSEGERSLDDIASLISKFFNNEDIDYCIVGGLAVSTWGEPRSTRDLGILLMLSGENVSEFVSFLEKNDFQVDTYSMDIALKENDHFTVFDEKSNYWIDIKVVGKLNGKKSIENAVKVKIGETEVRIASPEDTIINKLLFGSEQDIKDAKSIMIRQEELDEKYMKKLSKKLNVLEDYKNLKKEVKENLKRFTEGDY